MTLTIQHKHSLSHNFFSFLDPTQTNPRLTSPSSPQIMSPSDKPLSVPMPHSSAFTTTLSLSPLPPVKSDPQKQFLTSFAVLEFLIGAGLWVEGQMSGWRCLAGVGYLVVFDSLGVGIEVVQWKGLSGNLRRPYGWVLIPYTSGRLPMTAADISAYLDCWLCCISLSPSSWYSPRCILPKNLWNK